MALIDKLKNIANAIRSKTNKSEGLTLEQMASEVSGIDTLQGLDFSEIYNAEQADELNKYYKDGIAYAEEIKAENPNPSGSWTSKFYYNPKFIFLPHIDMSNITILSFAFSMTGIISLFGDTKKVTDFIQICYMCTALRKVILNTDSATTLRNAFGYCAALEHVELTSIKEVKDITNLFRLCYNLINLRLTKWANNDMSLDQSSKLSAESIKYIIWHALNGANTLSFENQGATSRTLQLHATPYTSWETWKLTKPSVEDCGFLGISEEEITKYGELTWEDIALNVKLITVAK